MDISFIHAYVDEAQKSLPQARPSSDSALTAFAQLALLRLNAHRAFISLFDRRYQYVIAETTASHSLRSNSNKKSEEGLLLCGIAFPKHYGVSSHVLDVATQSLLSSPTEQRLSAWQAPVTVIPDLRTDERFRGNRLVVENNDVCFYCGVPLRSPAGPLIGVLSISHYQSRSALSDIEEQFLRDMSATIVESLEASRAKREISRSTRMIRGLGSFVEGRTTMAGLHMPINTFPPGREDPENEGSLNTLQQERLHADEDKKGLISEESYLPSASPAIAGINHMPLRSESMPPPSQASHTSSTVDATQAVAKSPDNFISSDSNTSSPSTAQISFGRLFSKASNIIRESIEVEGVLFFDASLASVRHSTHTARRGSTSDATPLSSQSSSSGEESVQSTRTTTSGSPEKSCEVLGFSTTASSSIDDKKPNVGHLNVPIQFLRLLLRRYPEGRIFNFGEDGMLVSDTESDADQDASTGDIAAPEQRTAKLHRRPRKTYSRAKEASIIIKVFPGARSVIAFPLWDSHRERWFAGGVAWTRTAHRVFSVRGELSYLRAFGMAVMAEVANLDAQQTDKAKSDVLGSISHELRSPLHGLLGFVELLQGTDLDVFQASIAQTLETCGLTLLDTIGHLLDYAKINNLMRVEHQMRHERKRGVQHSESTRSTALGKVQKSSGVEVDAISEEVVESMNAGHSFRAPSTEMQQAHDDVFLITRTADKASSKISREQDHFTPLHETSQQHVKLILDIDPATNWTFVCHAGALRRILMNVFGNALKYTAAGSIKVKVSQQELQSNPGSSLSDVQIIVEDTGKGIGGEYLSHHLFTAFSQEDSLSAGNGLGLSITHQIVKSLGGKIDVRSTVGSGTIMSISLPLAHSISTEQSSEKSLFMAHINRTTAVRLSLFGFDDDKVSSATASSQSSKHWQLPRMSIERVCRDWLHMEVLPANESSIKPDVYIATQVGAEALAEKCRSGTTIQPVLVICPNATIARQLSLTSRTTFENGVFEFISQP